MRAAAFGFLITVWLASASGQTPVEQDRVFRLVHADTIQSLQEIATVIRSITSVRQVSTDTAQKTLTLRGTADQIALAEWLAGKLDQPAQQGRNLAAHEYRAPGGADDVVRVFYLTHAQTPQSLQEIATLVRSMADIRQLFTYNALPALALRGTAGQMALAEWLVVKLDQPAGGQAPSATHEYRVPGGADDVVRVFYLTHNQTAQNLQEIATLVRSIADISRQFTCNALTAMSLRGTAAQMALAEWLVGKLDTLPPRSEDSATYDYGASGSSENAVRIFYLTHAETPQSLQEIATLVRSTSGIRRLFLYNALRALSVRGTATQIAHAERLVKEHYKP